MTPRLPFSANDRVLVLGAGGWFGRTLTSLIQNGPPVLGIASHARGDLTVWDLPTIRDFAPTWVLNFAFLTPDRLGEVGVVDFARINDLLIDQFLIALELPSVRRGITISSGAAVTGTADIYGRLKQAEEAEALARTSQDRTVVVGRAYSLSGPFVTRPRSYAFSDMIWQALAGEISVLATQPTYRRYVSVADFLRVCMGMAGVDRSGVIESGGDLIEMGDLARRIVERVNPSASVRRRENTSDVDSVYASDNASWTDAVTVLGIEVESVDDQIDAVARWLAATDAAAPSVSIPRSPGPVDPETIEPCCE